LSHICCSYLTSLNMYKHRLDPTHTNLCPNCQVHPHTVMHLLLDFTHLAADRQHNITTVQHVWTDLVWVAAFLHCAGFTE
jgi:hypothetical protein